MASERPSAPSSARFFVLTKLLGGRHDTEFTKVEPVNFGPAAQCPRCGSFVSMLTWQPPYRIKLDLQGQEPADLVMAGSTLLVTEPFAQVFQAEGLTGLEGFHPVEVVRVRRRKREPKPAPPPPYLFVTAVRASAAVDEAHSRILRDKPPSCPECRSSGVDAVDGFTLEAGSWSGEDIFEARGLPGSLVVSERFARLAEKHALSHLTLVPTDKFVWDPLRRFYPDPTGGAQA
jgi:hypothetical protein